MTRPSISPEEMVALLCTLINREYRTAERTGDPKAKARARGLVDTRQFIKEAIRDRKEP